MGNCFVPKPKPQEEIKEQLKEEKGKVTTEPQNVSQKPEEDNQKKGQNDQSAQKPEPQPDEISVRQQLDSDEVSKFSNIDLSKKQRIVKKKFKKVRDEIKDEVVIFENIAKIQRQISRADIQDNKKSLGNHFVFSQLSDKDRYFKEEIIGQMFYCENSKDLVFKQGDQASSYFIIDKGECEIIINGEVKKKIGHGEAFGELALLYGAPRSASVRADGVCSFWGIDRNTFRRVVERIVHQEYEENRKFIENVKFFSNKFNHTFSIIAPKPFYFF